MRSGKCKGRNLLNHCRQKNIPKNLKITYSYNPKLYRKEWCCNITFIDSNNNTQEHSTKSYSKLHAIGMLLNNIESVLIENLNLNEII
jgi:hypothetical protein